LRDANSQRVNQEADVANWTAVHETANAAAVNDTRETIAIPFVQNLKYFIKYELLRTEHAHGECWPDQNGALEMLAQDVLQLLIPGKGAAGASSRQTVHVCVPKSPVESLAPVTTSSSNYIVPTTRTIDKRCVHGLEHSRARVHVHVLVLVHVLTGFSCLWVCAQVVDRPACAQGRKGLLVRQSGQARRC
jgi:hypothetical protein